MQLAVEYTRVTLYIYLSKNARAYHAEWFIRFVCRAGRDHISFIRFS